ncbi:MAG: phage scaffolding protein [Clostridia bacterium]|nr:phage scaffolding protein [Clostridia bacterium]
MEFLKAILGEELYATFSEKIKSHNDTNPDKAVKIADLASGAYVSKQKYDDAIAEIDGYKGQIATRDKDIEELKKAAAGDAELTTKYDELQGKYDKDTKDLQDKLAQTQFNAAFDVALAGSGAKNTKALRALLDMDKIKYENDALSGFNEQLEVIKKENDYLFEGETKSSGGMRHGSGISAEDSFIAGMREGAGLKE